MDELIERLRLRAAAHGGHKLLEEAAAALESLRAEVERLTGCLATANANHEQFERQWYLERGHTERLDEALREAKETMLSQVKWEACDCGCPQGRKPTDAVSVTWLRAVQQVEIATARAEELTREG